MLKDGAVRALEVDGEGFGKVGWTMSAKVRYGIEM